MADETRNLQARTLKIKRNLDLKTRTETFEGEEYLVVPVVALVETVVFASNSEHPELVPAESFSRAVSGWNGRPVFHGHPTDGESYVSGNTPKLLEEKSIGQVFNAKVRDKKLLMEAWLNIAKTKKVAPELLERIEEEDSVEVSVGVYVESEEESGEYGGKHYDGKWVDLVQDHLAILPEGEVGACSVNAGCGLRAASAKQEKDMQKGLVGRFMASVSQTLRSLVSASDMSDNDIRNKISEALQAVDPRAYWPDAVYADKGYFVYSVYDGSGVKCYKRNYTLSEDGKVTLSGDPKEVEVRVSYEEVGSGEVLTAASANAGAPCSCNKPSATEAPLSLENSTMAKSKQELIDKINALTEDQLAQATVEIAEPAAAAAPAAAAEAAAPAAAAAPTPAAAPAALTASAEVTFESLMEKASPEVREAFQAQQRTLQARKDATIKVLKDSGRCDISDEKLKTLSQAELDQLVKLAGVDRAATDYSGMGTVRPADQPAEVADPPSLGDAITAARAKEQPAKK